MKECNQTSLDDIEDIGTIIQKENLLNTRNNRNQLVPRFKKRKGKNDENTDSVDTHHDSLIPGTQKIYVKTWGCAHNNSDSEYMAGLLAQYGYKIIDEPTNADLWLLNSCTVKGPAEDHFRNAVEAGMEQNKHVVVAGCVPQSAPKNNYLRGLSIIGVQQIERVVEVVEETLKGHSVQVLGNKKENGRKTGGADLSLPKIRKNPLIEIIPISTGCLNQCTYCKTKHARGQLGSYSIKEIVDRAIQAFEEGVKEIWLTSEDTGAYGIDIGTTLPKLLRNLVQVIPEGCMLRLGMTNPPYILNHIEEMADILSHQRVYAFLHIPVQSGSDCILGDMKREYCIEDFEKIVQFLREKVPGLTIATDIICGFPTETEKDFEETISLVRKYKFPSLFINQFYPRPGTPAAKMQRVPAQEVKIRTKRLTELFQSYRTYDHRVGQQFPILVTELSHDKKHYVGHNKYYEQVLIPKEEHFMGKEVLVNITSAGKHFLIGDPVSEREIKQTVKKNNLYNGNDFNITQSTWFTPLWCISCLIVILAALLSKLYAASWFSI